LGGFRTPAFYTSLDLCGRHPKTFTMHPKTFTIPDFLPSFSVRPGTVRVI